MKTSDAVLTVEERGLLLAESEKLHGLSLSLKRLSADEEALSDSEECLAMREAFIGESLDAVKFFCAFCGEGGPWYEEVTHKPDCLVTAESKMPDALDRKELANAIGAALIRQADGKAIPKEARLSRKERTLVCSVYLALLKDISPLAYAKLRFMLEVRGVS